MRKSWLEWLRDKVAAGLAIVLLCTFILTVLITVTWPFWALLLAAVVLV